MVSSPWLRARNQCWYTRNFYYCLNVKTVEYENTSGIDAHLAAKRGAMLDWRQTKTARANDQPG